MNNSLKVRIFTADIELQDIFNATSVIQDVIFRVNCNSTNLAYSTHFAELKLSSVRLDLIQKSYILIKRLKFINSDKIVDTDPNQFKRNTNIDENELKIIRKGFGNDSIMDFEINEEHWVCYCGATNEKEDSKCHRCGREIEDLNLKTNTSSKLNWNMVKGILLSKENGTEIYKYIKRINELNKLELDSLVYELNMLASREKWDGNMKDTALNMIKKLI